jgi:hypothetical protein
MPEEKEKQLMQSLQKGNVQSVNFVKDGKETPMFIEASPQFKSINVYDTAGHQLNKMEKEPYLKEAAPALVHEPESSLKETTSLPKEEIKKSPGTEKKSNETSRAAVKKTKTVKDLMPQKGGSNRKALRV